MFERALEIDASDHQLVINLASAHYWAGRHVQATQLFERAIEMVESQLEVNVRDASLLATMGMLRAQTQRVAESESFLARALELTPNDVEVMAMASEAYEMLGDRDSALRWAKSALEEGYPVDALETNPTLSQLMKDPRCSASTTFPGQRQLEFPIPTLLPLST